MAVIRNTQIPGTKGELLFGFTDLLELLLHHWLEDIRVALEKDCPDVALEVTDCSPGHHPCSPGSDRNGVCCGERMAGMPWGEEGCRCLGIQEQFLNGCQNLMALWWALCCTLKSSSACTENLMGLTGLPQRGQSGFLLSDGIMPLQTHPVVPGCLNRTGPGKHR